MLDKIITHLEKYNITIPSPNHITKMKEIWDNFEHYDWGDFEHYDINHLKTTINNLENFSYSYIRHVVTSDGQHRHYVPAIVKSSIESGLLKSITDQNQELYDNIKPLNLSIENGHLKSNHRIIQKINDAVKGGTAPHVPDISRFRIVAPNILLLFEAIENISNILSTKYDNVYNVNYYDSLTAQPKHKTHRKGVNTYWSKKGESLIQEIQFVTENTRSYMDLDHPLHVSKTVPHLNDASKEYIETLILKAYLSDLWDLYYLKY